jgi:uncharacterized membrane protein YdjX (TVP38/TMEM64 family)
MKHAAPPSLAKTKLLQRIGRVLSVLVLAAIVFFGVTYHREIWAILTQTDARDAFVQKVRDAGAWGFLLFLALQVLQVVLAVIPGEAVELMAGLLYGTWGGLLVCLLGVLIGAMCVYSFERLVGAHSLSEQALQKYRFLRDESHLKFCLFLVFFIPGTPKDMLTYSGPFLPIKAHEFFLISTLARIPSILSSTFAASRFAAGQWQLSLAVYAVTGGVAVLCAWQQERILRFIDSQKEKMRHTIGKNRVEKSDKP